MAIEETFQSGFIEGYKTVKGKLAPNPPVPPQPPTPPNMTPFRMGIVAGIKRAGGLK